MSLPDHLPPNAQRALGILQHEAPEYAAAFGKFLFVEIYGVEWKEAGELNLGADEWYVPSNPNGEVG